MLDPLRLVAPEPASSTPSAVETPCPRCGGSGWEVRPDGGAGTATPCDCRQRDRIPQLLAMAGVPERYAGCSFRNFEVNLLGAKERLATALAVCQRYVDGFVDLDSGHFRETGLLLLGPPGGGKTHLAVAALHELIRRYGVRGRFVDFTTLIHQIQATFDPTSSESKQTVLDPVINAEVLVLDELGAQRPTPWVNDILYLVLNTRYTRRRPTLFTTNYRLEPVVSDRAAPAERDAQRGGERGERGAERAAGGHELLATRLPPALLSRLAEMTLPVPLEVDDFRREYKMARQRI
jgi:DNA replication protein DnaC